MQARFVLKWLLPEKKHKGYDINFKLEAVEYAEMNSNEKAAKKFPGSSVHFTQKAYTARINKRRVSDKRRVSNKRRVSDLLYK